jgi:hypothetical protein
LAISNSGSWAYNVGLVVFVFNVTHSAGWVAAASMTRFLTAVVVSPIGGLIADRVERVRLMITINVVAMGCQALLAAAALHAPVVFAQRRLSALGSDASVGLDADVVIFVSA